MGGSTQTTVENKELPLWYQEAAMDQINLGKRLGEIGMIPYMGPEVAAFAPQEVAGMQGSDNLAAAFGMPSVGDVGASLMQPTDFGGGLMGYSSFPGYEQVLSDFSAQYPALARYLAMFSMDPISGEQAEIGWLDPATSEPDPLPRYYDQWDPMLDISDSDAQTVAVDAGPGEGIGSGGGS